MRIHYQKLAVLLAVLTSYASLGLGQGLYVVQPPDTTTVKLGTPSPTLSKTTLRDFDSLEVTLLEITRSYQQVERLMASFPPQSRYLDMLPSVLPVDLPIEDFRITSTFGDRLHPMRQEKRFHAGLDVKAASGMTVKATADGVVERVGHNPELGAFVQILHAFGFETVYGHLSGFCVNPGDTVSRNQEIGRVGATGLATGPHLHYAIRKNGLAIDPYNFCFLLRRCLWIYEEKSKASGITDPEDAKCLSSKGE